MMSNTNGPKFWLLATSSQRHLRLVPAASMLIRNESIVAIYHERCHKSRYELHDKTCRTNCCESDHKVHIGTKFYSARSMTSLATRQDYRAAGRPHPSSRTWSGMTIAALVVGRRLDASPLCLCELCDEISKLSGGMAARRWHTGRSARSRAMPGGQSPASSRGPVAVRCRIWAAGRVEWTSPPVKTLGRQSNINRPAC